MAEVVERATALLRTTRIRVKAFGYSGPARGRWQQPDKVLAALEPLPGTRVADIGAGAGYFTFPLAAAVGSDGIVYAVDTDSDMTVAVAGRAARGGFDNVQAVRAPEDEPGLPEAVDLALVVNAFHHLPDPAAYVRELARQLRPGGRVAIIEPVPRWFLFGHATAPETIREQLTGAGYRLTADHDFLRRQSFLVFDRPGSDAPK